MNAKSLFLGLFSLLLVSGTSAQQSSLEILDRRSVTTDDVPYSNGRSIIAEVKPTKSLGLPDYYYGINLSLSPHSDGGWGLAYQLNFNWTGLHFRRSNASNIGQWDAWSKVITTNYWDGSVELEGNLSNMGRVGIGVKYPQYELDVNGTIRAKEVRVESGWADFVFKKDYQLPSLQEVKAHIDEHQHLPGIPSEAEVKENGVGLAEMTTKLLQKVEELTLYAIQQQETIEKLNNKVQELENTKK